MSKEEAQRMLESLKNAEQKLQLQRKQKGDKEIRINTNEISLCN